MTPESCAKEIVDKLFSEGRHAESYSYVSASIQRLLSSEVAKVRNEYQPLVEASKIISSRLAHPDLSVTYLDEEALNKALAPFWPEALAPNKEGQTNETR